jgi:hypothetical protein
MNATRGLFILLASAVVGFAGPQEDAPALTQSEIQLLAICQEMYSAYDSYETQADTLKDDVARREYLADNDPWEPFVLRLIEFAETHHGSHAGLMALRRLVLLGAGGGVRGNPRDLGRRFALSRLLDYGRSPELPEILRYLDVGNVEPAVAGFLRKLNSSENASTDNRMFSRFMLARWMLSQKIAHEFWKRRLRELDGGDQLRSPNEREDLEASLLEALPSKKLSAMEQEAIAILEDLAQSESAVQQPGVTKVDEDWFILRNDSQKTKSMPLVSMLADGLLFKQKYLQIGRQSPALEIRLVDGERWSLAQQRGKTVIIQFSHKACGPCVAMYPNLKVLANAHPESLSILSIMADESKSDTLETIESGKVDWSVCWDGWRGPIATRWGAKSFPTVYVVGTDGRIAGYGLRGDSLKSKIVELATIRPK